VVGNGPRLYDLGNAMSWGVVNSTLTSKSQRPMGWSDRSSGLSGRCLLEGLEGGCDCQNRGGVATFPGYVEAPSELDAN